MQLRVASGGVIQNEERSNTKRGKALYASGIVFSIADYKLW